MPVTTGGGTRRRQYKKTWLSPRGGVQPLLSLAHSWGGPSPPRVVPPLLLPVPPLRPPPALENKPPCSVAEGQAPLCSCISPGLHRGGLRPQRAVGARRPSPYIRYPQPCDFGDPQVSVLCLYGPLLGTPPPVPSLFDELSSIQTNKLLSTVHEQKQKQKKTQKGKEGKKKELGMPARLRGRSTHRIHKGKEKNSFLGNANDLLSKYLDRSFLRKKRKKKEKQNKKIENFFLECERVFVIWARSAVHAWVWLRRE